MKKITFVLSGFVLLTTLVLLSSSTSDSGGHLSTLNAPGTAVSTGAPGEPHTCSQAGCHGAGNGNGSSGGLADNAGPGNMSISSIPLMSGNQYTPGVTYSMVVTVNETGKTIFGFDAEILDNSGNTNLAVNNTAGTLTITNPVKTHIMQAFGTGRATVTHKTSAGIAVNTCTFGFNWKAPASGTVNIYGSAVAGNHDSLASAADNVYLFYQQVKPAPTGIDAISPTAANAIIVFPNPASDKVTVSFTVNREEYLTLQIRSMDGRLVKLLEVIKAPEGEFSQNYTINDLPAGAYLLQVNSNATNFCKKLYVN